MRRRAFFSALLAPTVPVVLAASTGSAAYAEPFSAYNRESFWDLQESGAPLAVIVARHGCVNAPALDGARRALSTLAADGVFEALEARWEEVEAEFAQDYDRAPGVDEVRVAVYRDGALVGTVLSDGDAAGLERRLRGYA